MAGGVAEDVVMLLVEDEFYRGGFGNVKYQVGRQLRKPQNLGFVTDWQPYR